MCPTLTARKKKGLYFFLYILSGNKVLQPNDLKIFGLELEKIIALNFFMKYGVGLILLTIKLLVSNQTCKILRRLKICTIVYKIFHCIF